MSPPQDDKPVNYKPTIKATHILGQNSMCNGPNSSMKIMIFMKCDFEVWQNYITINLFEKFVCSALSAVNIKIRYLLQAIEALEVLSGTIQFLWELNDKFRRLCRLTYTDVKIKISKPVTHTRTLHLTFIPNIPDLTAVSKSALLARVLLWLHFRIWHFHYEFCTACTFFSLRGKLFRVSPKVKAPH